tara:strand:- start:3740 stop:4207 length:468 start_codon:yes stop_codon:yes gene_type:complete
MRSDFSNAWKSSSQTRKQRKYRYNAPLHIQGKFLGVHLSKELRKKYGTRSMRIRKGDEVKVLRGSFSGKSGKVAEVDVKRGRVTIDGMQNKKKDGTKINAFFNSSNLVVTTLNNEDKKRFKRRKVVESKKVEKKVEPKKEEVKKTDLKETKEEKK